MKARDKWLFALMIAAIVGVPIIAYYLANLRQGSRVTVDDFTPEATGKLYGMQDGWMVVINISLKYEGDSTLNALWVMTRPVNVTFSDGSSKVPSSDSPNNVTANERISKGDFLFSEITLGGLDKRPAIVWVYMATKVQESEEVLEYLTMVGFQT